MTPHCRLTQLHIQAADSDNSVPHVEDLVAHNPTYLLIYAYSDLSDIYTVIMNGSNQHYGT